ncbi:hypothetical protein [Achromobacter sp. ACRQX]|uniref:hypothetical protein n=1 Tax=Achromobacter sp. ACRQX TaxID=2918181 RepID=UPI001EF2FEF9|nr:hypothetical protein [Achromobacter sp. ACRQX]MCG7324322.1 hypothetical protein [Achromobacter sp. ACRQX]
MQSDRELLVLAAKAAGYLKFQYCETSGGLQAIYVEDGGIGFWEPLIDDGDALRLAVKLKIDLKLYDDHVVAWFGGGYIGTGKILYGDDPQAATRRAIVRAAAELAQPHPDHKDGGA